MLEVARQFGKGKSIALVEDRFYKPLLKSFFLLISKRRIVLLRGAKIATQDV